jgi:preprotein translocase subunit SecD
VSTRPVTVLLAVVGVVLVSAVALVGLGVIHMPWMPPSSPDASDLSGTRLRVEYEVLPVGDVAPGPDDLAVVADIVRRRLETVGIADVSVTVSGTDRIAVEVPSVTDGFVVRRLVARSGRLDFVPLGNDQVEEGQILDLRTHPPLFSGDQIAAASAGTDASGISTVDFKLRPEAATLFADYTAAHIGELFAITLDGRVLSAPVIQSGIEGGEVQISMAGSAVGPVDVGELVAILQYGSIPWLLHEVGTAPVPSAAGGGG